MYRYLGICLLFLITSLKVVLGFNYCDAELCKKYTINGGVYNVPHIGCNNNGDFGGKCPQNAKAEILTDEIHKFLLNEHNKYRNAVAGGQVDVYRSAIRMLPLKWHPELANLSLFYSKMCTPGHDSCHNTATFKNSGQTNFQSSGPGPLDLMIHLTEAVGSWYGEYVYANMTIINSWKPTTPDSSQFTTICGDRQNYFGCGTVRFSANDTEHLITTCNYASTNILGKPIYKLGPVASACETGPSRQYSSLCTSLEVIDPNVI